MNKIFFLFISFGSCIVYAADKEMPLNLMPTKIKRKRETNLTPEEVRFTNQISQYSQPRLTQALEVLALNENDTGLPNTNLSRVSQVRCLLASGAEFNVSSARQGLPLGNACRGKHTQESFDIIKTLVRAKANVNATAQYQGLTLMTAVYAASTPLSPSIVRYLLQHNANPNIKDATGESILSKCGKFWFPCTSGIVGDLLKFGANPQPMRSIITTDFNERVRQRAQKTYSNYLAWSATVGKSLTKIIVKKCLAQTDVDDLPVDMQELILEYYLPKKFNPKLWVALQPMRRKLNKHAMQLR